MNSESSPTEISTAPNPEPVVEAVPAKALPAPPLTVKFPFHIPPLLLEGDDVEPETLVEDPQKFCPESNTPADELEPEGELPEAYGTQQLLLTARDPHWLCAHWDLTAEQKHGYCGRDDEGQLLLRVQRADLAGQPVAEIQVNSQARHWFVHVADPGAMYCAELGCRTPAGEWLPISTSSAASTPPNWTSENNEAEFATIPFELPMAKLSPLTGGAAAPTHSLTQALETLRQEGHPDLPGMPPASIWTADQAGALAALSVVGAGWPAPPSSLTLAEYSQHPSLELPTSPGGASSPFGGFQGEKSFWFNINAELIVYGATEPEATVTIGGQPIPLRPDGSFSFRFALPDGQHELPVVAISCDRTDARAAELKFARATERRGEVGTHPQNPELKPPAPENIPVMR